MLMELLEDTYSEAINTVNQVKIMNENEKIGKTKMKNLLLTTSYRQRKTQLMKLEWTLKKHTDFG